MLFVTLYDHNCREWEQYAVVLPHKYAFCLTLRNNASFSPHVSMCPNGMIDVRVCQSFTACEEKIVYKITLTFLTGFLLFKGMLCYLFFLAFVLFCIVFLSQLV